VVYPKGDKKRFNFVDTDEITVGRDPSCTLPLDATSDTVSAKHLKIRLDGGKVLVEDTKSANGIFVRDHRVEKTTVASGDEIGLGQSGPRLRVYFVAPTVLESSGGISTAPTVLEMTRDIPAASSSTNPRYVSTGKVIQPEPPSQALTRVGSKTVMAM